MHLSLVRFAEPTIDNILIYKTLTFGNLTAFTWVKKAGKFSIEEITIKQLSFEFFTLRNIGR